MPNNQRGIKKTAEDLAFNAVVGRNIKYLRKCRNLNQTRVANFCNVKFQQLQKYEKGNNGTSSFRLNQLAKFFGVTMDVLVDPQMITIHKNLTPQDAGYLKPQKDIGSLEEIMDTVLPSNDEGDYDDVRMVDKEHLKRQLRK
jgi:transcriptional regulator with XRE-family HTH domain|tara:strand:+ start:696 stop:1121 length:426 start_codon:yes stop_codon:yes gene_type:complete